MIRTGTKLLLNVALKSYVTIVKAGDKVFRISCMSLKDENSSELVPTTYLFKTKSTQELEILFNEVKRIVKCELEAKEALTDKKE
jgi:hypothetical protein